jgi:hypothetical protein
MHVACAVSQFRHVEYFHDHARIESWLFDGFIPPEMESWSLIVRGLAWASSSSIPMPNGFLRGEMDDLYPDHGAGTECKSESACSLI